MSDKDDKYFPWRRICIYLCFLSFIFGFSLYHFRIFPFRYIRMSLAGTAGVRRRIAPYRRAILRSRYGAALRRQERELAAARTTYRPLT